MTTEYSFLKQRALQAACDVVYKQSTSYEAQAIP